MPDKEVSGTFTVIVLVFVFVVFGTVVYGIAQSERNESAREAAEAARKTVIVSGLVFLTPECSAPLKPQPRPVFENIDVPFEMIEWPPEDGDTVVINWTGEDGKLEDVETVRFFGADTPEIEHFEMGWFEEQPFAYEALDFLSEQLAAAGVIELTRGECTDPYGRTLGYLFLDGENYSAAVVTAGLAHQTISKYGPQGFYDEAAEVEAASEITEPLGLEDPHDFRARMRNAAAKAETK